MPKNDKKSAGTTPKAAENKPLAKGVFENAFASMRSHNPMLGFLKPDELAALSEASRTTRDMTADAREKQALESLLTAVVKGNEDLAKKIITSRPELLLVSSAVVKDPDGKEKIIKDLSGKEIKDLTPFQAAICAGDDDMWRMIIKVLQQKQRAGALSFDPERAIQDQLKVIFPKGIDEEEKKQKDTAEAFKNSTLNDLLTKINAATPEQVEAELNNPGQDNPNSPLNEALRAFREQFSATANNEQIFNPFYLKSAFDFYVEQINNFNDWNHRYLFCNQIIGYIQRHLPACYLQAFAQGIYHIAERGDRLERNFKLKYDKAYYMRPDRLDNGISVLGYHYWVRDCGGSGVRDVGGVASWEPVGGDFSKIIADKKIRLGKLISGQWPTPPAPTRCVIA